MVVYDSGPSNTQRQRFARCFVACSTSCNSVEYTNNQNYGSFFKVKYDKGNLHYVSFMILTLSTSTLDLSSAEKYRFFF